MNGSNQFFWAEMFNDHKLIAHILPVFNFVCLHIFVQLVHEADLVLNG